MNDKIEVGKGLFNYIEEKLKTRVGTGLLSFIIGVVLVGSYSYIMTELYRDRIQELQEYKAKNETEIVYLKKQLDLSEDECVERFLIFREAIHEIQKGVENTSKVTKDLADHKKESVKEFSNINEKIKKK